MTNLPRQHKSLPDSSVLVQKRLFDVCAASLVLMMITPLIAIITLSVIVINSGLPVFFNSARIGQHSKPFMMPKFRSMSKKTPLVPTAHFDRPERYINWFGRLLRKTSFDEIPQLWSVVKGDMSLIGPRPVLSEGEEAAHNMREKYLVTQLKPGITGWAQVNGRNNISMKAKVQLDCEYRQRLTLWFDLYILWLTIRNLLTQRDY